MTFDARLTVGSKESEEQSVSDGNAVSCVSKGRGRRGARRSYQAYFVYSESEKGVSKSTTDEIRVNSTNLVDELVENGQKGRSIGQSKGRVRNRRAQSAWVSCLGRNSRP